MRSLATYLFLSGVVYTSASPLERNLAYRSPFIGHPQFAHDTGEIHDRHVRNYRKRQALEPIESAAPFKDEHYPTFYGGNFSESSFVWNGGINFTHSVASGDPFDTSILLWTRAVPTSVATAEASSSSTASNALLPSVDIPVCVSFALSTSPTLSGKPLKSGTAFTSYDVGWTIKVEVDGLNPDTVYWFQFADCTNKNSASPVGKTRTLASANTPAEEVNGGKPLTFAVFSCSQFQTGWFNAYGVAALNTSADVFIHVGDYIYEHTTGGASIGRSVEGRELATIHDYRQRLAQYRTDASLVAAHEAGPWITVWDDHEVADQSWKAGTADSNDSFVGSPSGCAFSPSGACFTDRKLAAVRAYHEWLPVRQVQADDLLRIWRNFQVGKLLDLTMLDTRQYDRDITDLYYNTEYINTLADLPGRSLMGPEQESWLYNTLDESVARGATWRVIGQQIVFTQLNEMGVFDLDAWDGYRQNRLRVLDHLHTNKIDNTIILSGDSHANWVSDLAHPNDTTTYNSSTGSGAIGVEFAGTAVTSPSSFGTGISPLDADTISTQLLTLTGNEDLQWTEGSYRGFFTLTIGPQTLNATYYAMKNISNPNLDAFASATFVVHKGANKLTRPVAGGSVKAGVLRSSVDSN